MGLYGFGVLLQECAGVQVVALKGFFILDGSPVTAVVSGVVAERPVWGNPADATLLEEGDKLWVVRIKDVVAPVIFYGIWLN